MRLSYSSSKTYLACPHKFYLEKIVKAPVDPDVTDDKEALRFGSAFHKVLELTHHDHTKFTMDIFNKCCAEETLDEGLKYRVYASLTAYYQLHRASKLTVVGMELVVGIAEEFIGYVDAVMADANGNWWIVDLKTASQVSETMFARLERDPQLNLYAYFRGQLAEALGLNPAQFAGARYRPTAKSKHKLQPNEDMKAFAKRAALASYDVEIPFSAMRPEEAWEEIKKAATAIDSLTKTPIRNRDECFAYFSPCPYWSHCHDGTYTDCQKRVTVFNKATMCDRTIAPVSIQTPVEEIIDEMELLS